MTDHIKTFSDYLKYRELGFFSGFDPLTQSYPLLRGGCVTMDELYRDFNEFMENGGNGPIRFFL